MNLENLVQKNVAQLHPDRVLTQKNGDTEEAVLVHHLLASVCDDNMRITGAAVDAKGNNILIGTLVKNSRGHYFYCQADQMTLLED